MVYLLSIIVLSFTAIYYRLEMKIEQNNEILLLGGVAKINTERDLGKGVFKGDEEHNPPPIARIFNDLYRFLVL